MSDKKQSSVDFIFNAFNLLSDADFKAWMLNNHNKFKAMHKEEVMNAVVWFDDTDRRPHEIEIEVKKYYNETFGGQDNE